MTPEQEMMLKEVWAWMQQKKQQQISYPLDEASRNSLGVPTRTGTGSHALTQQITIGAGGGDANVPAAYSGTVIFLADGTAYEIPYL